MKRGVRGICLLLAVLFSMTGCLPGEVPPADGSPHGDLTVPLDESERERVTLEVWYAISGTSGEKFVEQATAFDESSDLVDLELSYSGGANDTAAKMSAALLAGTAPDVAVMYAGAAFTGSLGNFTMDQLIQREGFHAEDIYPGMWDYCKYYASDAVCAVPYGISTQVLYYNKDILAAAGVDMTDPPKTWDEFYAVCLQVLEEWDGGDNFAVFDADPAGWLFRSMLVQNGCSIVEEGGIAPVFNEPAAVEAAEYWQKLVESGIMPAGEHDVAESRFLSGNLAFLAMSCNRISRWSDVDINIGAIEMPYFTQPSLALSGNVLTVFTQDRQKLEAAWELIEYLLEPERQAEFALYTGYLPVRRSALNLPEVQNAIAENDIYRVAFDQLSYAWACVHFEQMGTMNLAIDDALSRIEKGVLTPQAALDGAVEQVREELAVSARQDE